MHEPSLRSCIVIDIAIRCFGNFGMALDFDILYNRALVLFGNIGRLYSGLWYYCAKFRE